MKKIIPLTLLALILSMGASRGQRIDARKIGHLEGDIVFASSISTTTELEELNYSVYLLPENYEDLEASVNYAISTDEHGNELLELMWEDFKGGDFWIRARVKNEAKFSSVGIVPFPYSPPKEVWVYLEGTNKSAITDAIREKAREIALGSDHGFEAISKLSHWIHENVEYDLRYGDVNLGSDWVYVNRVGTCDEFANLFVAMARSVGIPARYVAGAIYSKGGWGYHAWAEVYLDEWVPVDPTWDEIGWVDATHIGVGKFKDADEVTMKLKYISRRPTRVEGEMPKVSVQNLKTRDLEEAFSIKSRTYPTKIGLGDRAIVELRIETHALGCLATSTEIIPRVDQRGNPVVSVNESKLISICPREEKEVHFLVQATDDLKRGYLYHNLADIRTFLGESVVVDLELDTSDDRESEIDLMLDEQTTLLGERIGFKVISDVDYRVYSDLPIKGNEIEANKIGDHYIIAVTEMGDAIKGDLVVMKSLDFRIKDIKKPVEVKCGEEFNVSFYLENLGGPMNIQISAIMGEELSEIESVNLDLRGGEDKEIILKARAIENCTGEDQFVSLMINDQRIHEKIRIKKEEKISNFIIELLLSIVRRIRELFS